MQVRPRILAQQRGLRLRMALHQPHTRIRMRTLLPTVMDLLRLFPHFTFMPRMRTHTHGIHATFIGMCDATRAIDKFHTEEIRLEETLLYNHETDVLSYATTHTQHMFALLALI